MRTSGALLHAKPVAERLATSCNRSVSDAEHCGRVSHRGHKVAALVAFVLFSPVVAANAHASARVATPAGATHEPAVMPSVSSAVKLLQPEEEVLAAKYAIEAAEQAGLK